MSTVGVVTLTEFLLARIAEDEAIARGGAPFDDPSNHDDDYSRDWYFEHNRAWHTAWCGWRVGEGLAKECDCEVPARVLAECEAKRRIVELHAPKTAREMGGESDTLITCWTCGPDEDVDFRIDWREMHYPCPTLCLLALPYVEHADYRDEWAMDDDWGTTEDSP